MAGASGFAHAQTEPVPNASAPPAGTQLTFREALSRTLAVAAVLAVLWLTVSLMVLKPINPERSASGFMTSVMAKADRGAQLGLLGYKEQFLLYLTRPIVNFGHARWREGEQESYDAAAWLNGGPARELLVSEQRLRPCFEDTAQREAGTTGGERWFLVRGLANGMCAAKGNAARTLAYSATPSGGR